jgi:hypothetical protein
MPDRHDGAHVTQLREAGQDLPHPSLDPGGVQRPVAGAPNDFVLAHMTREASPGPVPKRELCVGLPDIQHHRAAVFHAASSINFDCFLSKMIDNR